MQPTVLRDEFQNCSPIWNIKLSPSSLLPSWYTNAYQAELFPLAENVKGFATAYVLQKTRSSGGVPIIRQGLDRYSNRGGGQNFLLGYFELEPLEGQGQLSLWPDSPNSRELSRRSTTGNQLLGHAWIFPESEDEWNGVTHTVTAGERTDEIFIARRCGAYVCRWHTSIPSAGINREWMRRFDYGAGIGPGEFYRENFGVDLFVHNPTQFGCIRYNGGSAFPHDDHHIAFPSPIIDASIGPGTESPLRIQSYNIPLEWTKNGLGQLGIVGSPIEQHDNTDYQPCLWWRVRHQLIVDVNWQGRVGVTRIRQRSYSPVPFFSFGGIEALTMATFAIDSFDQVWVYDAGSDTMTDVGWNPAVETNARWTSWLDQYTKEVPQGNLVASGASQIPSGYGGYILRASGTIFGPADGLCVGYYGRIMRPRQSEGAPAESGITEMILAINHTVGGPMTVDGIETLVLAAQIVGSSRPSGWIGLQCWQVVDTLSNVQAKMRQLFLDGIGDSRWDG